MMYLSLSAMFPAGVTGSMSQQAGFIQKSTILLCLGCWRKLWNGVIGRVTTLDILYGFGKRGNRPTLKHSGQKNTPAYEKPGETVKNRLMNIPLFFA